MLELLSHPKVGHIGLKIAVQQDIATFDVTMYNGYITVMVQVRELELRLSPLQLF